MINRKKKFVPYLFLGAVTVFICWFFAGRFGMFASTLDWISQHSVIPDYFRRQFYETGELFPEFAPSLGGGQNIYNFSYYGLYSPVILLSYLLPFVKMSDYLMAASVLCLAAAGMLLYYWLKSCRVSRETALCCAVMLLLAAPMVYQSYRQVMFVSYMPFLCMALIGTERYWKSGKTGLFTAGVFLMILTSFYFSIAGIMSLAMYGLSRYRKVSWKRPLFRLGLSGLAAVCASGILLVPTAYVLLGRSGGAKEQQTAELFMPDFSAVRFACSGYGIGLTTGIFAVLVTGLFYKNWKERLLSAGLLAVITVPFFSWLLNGGLYARDKALIPFLPVLLYMTAVYLEKMKRRELPLWMNLAGYLSAVLWCVCSFMVRKQGISTKRYEFLLFESVLLFVCFCIYWKSRRMLFLTMPSIVCLALFAINLNRTEGDIIAKSRYKDITDRAWETQISDILSTEQGLYRLEQAGDSAKKKDNINRIWNTRQWVSSVYSSACQQDYQNFREHVFQTEQPFRNGLMQSSSENPLFQKLMGVKYMLKREEESGTFAADVKEYAAPVIYATDSLICRKEYEKLPFPYNQTALMQYAVIENGGITEGLISDDTVKRQHTEGDKKAQQRQRTEGDKKAQQEQQIKIAEKALQERRADAGINVVSSSLHPVKQIEIVIEAESRAVKEESGTYFVRSKQPVPALLKLSGNKVRDWKNCEEEQLLYLQFDVRNNRKSRDVTVELNGVRNRLSARNHIYYNGNTAFTYAVLLAKGQTEAEILFGEGDYQISDIRAFTGSSSILQDDALYQSQFYPDWKKTKGNRISGTIFVKRTGYLVTSIPYDKGFTILADGKNIPARKVNTAFLGAPVSEGEHQIEIVFHAPGLKTGKVLSAAGGILWAGMLLMQGLRRAKGDI